MSDSPAEYIAELKQTVRELRNALMHVVQEKNVILEQLAKLSADYQRLRAETGRTPHDYEPARPGLSEVD